MKYDLSVVIPSIRVNNLPPLYNSLVESLGNYTFELIIVGPFYPSSAFDNLVNFKFIKDFGSVARCAQMGLLLAEGEFFCTNSDDALFQPNALKECLDLIKSKTEKDGIILRYYEGVNRVGKLPEDWYWHPRHHKDQQIPGILDEWLTAPVGLFNTQYAKSLGFLDTRFEQVNMNMHDFSFRLQKNGGKLYLSPSLVMACDWEPGYSGAHAPLEEAYHVNDGPLFKELYSKYDPDRIKIDLNNWMNSPSVWRRFKVQ